MMLYICNTSSPGGYRCGRHWQGNANALLASSSNSYLTAAGSTNLFFDINYGSLLESSEYYITFTGLTIIYDFSIVNSTITNISPYSSGINYTNNRILLYQKGGIEYYIGDSLTSSGIPYISDWTSNHNISIYLFSDDIYTVASNGYMTASFTDNRYTYDITFDSSYPDIYYIGTDIVYQITASEALHSFNVESSLYYIS